MKAKSKEQRAKNSSQRCSLRPNGMTLLEVILALALFSLAAVALVQQINAIAKITLESRNLRNVEQQLEGIMDEYSKMPQIAELDKELKPDANGVSYKIKIEPVQDIRTKAGIQLNGLFRITVKAMWSEDSQKLSLQESTLRYAGMFNPVQ